MKPSIKIPKFFHELFGSHQLTSELLLILCFTLTSTLLVAWTTTPYWITLKWYQNMVLWLMFLDITGGVVANLSGGTNSHYNTHAKGRWLFIAIHIQPLLIASVLQSPMTIAVAVWLYTIISASIINLVREKVYHRLLAGCFYALGLIIFILSGLSLPHPIAVLYLLYMMKVIYSFSVNHDKEA